MSHVYRGWWIVAVCGSIAMLVYGFGFFAFTLFISPLTDEFLWTRASTAGAVSFFFLASPLSLLTGPLVRRVGVRTLILIGVLIEGIALCSIAMVEDLWQLYALRAVMGLGKICVVVALPILVSYWFSRRYPSALSVVLACFPLGGAVAAPVTQHLIDSVGWRQTALSLGLILIGFTVPLVVFGLRTIRPPNLGPLADGRAKATLTGDKSGNVPPDTERGGLGLRLLLGNRVLWIVLFATVTTYFAYGSILAHEVTWLTEIGLSPQRAADILALTATMAALGLLVAGGALVRFSLRRVTITMFSLCFLALVSGLFLSYSYSNSLLITFAILFGITIGGFDVVWMSVLQREFDQEAFEDAFGIWYFTSLAVLFGGPMIAGALYDHYGHYNAVLLAASAGILAGFSLLSRLRFSDAP